MISIGNNINIINHKKNKHLISNNFNSISNNFNHTNNFNLISKNIISNNASNISSNNLITHNLITHKTNNINNNLIIDTINRKILKKYLDIKLHQKYNNNYNPDKNNIKYLALMACHCNSEIKLSTIKTTLTNFNFESVYVLLINTINLPYNKEIKEICSTYKNIKYIECENEATYDFGKWIHGLNNINYNEYDYTIFINDSFIIHEPIYYFFNLIYKSNNDFYGYNDSTQTRYHYQSYLFSLKKNAIEIFIKNYNLKKNCINDQGDVIIHYETTMTDWFNNKNCFLKIGELNFHKGKNIFFTSDTLYNILKNASLLPFTKIKRII
jgi:hypothetical protein